MGKRPLLVSIANQKGGVGKSTTTALVAAYLHNYTPLKICVIDIDPQDTLVKYREAEIENHLTRFVEDRSYKKTWLELRKAQPKKDHVFAVDGLKEVDPDGMLAYNLIQSRLEKDFDIIFVDFPGFTASEGLMISLMQMDYILCPFTADYNTILSTHDFLEYVFKAKEEGEAKAKKIAAFKWRYSLVKNTSLVHASQGELMSLFNKLYMFESHIPDAVEYERYSTLIPTNLKGAKSIEPFVNEFLEFIGINKLA